VREMRDVLQRKRTPGWNGEVQKLRMGHRVLEDWRSRPVVFEGKWSADRGVSA